MPVCLSMSAHQQTIPINEKTGILEDQGYIDFNIRAWNNCLEGMVWDGQGLT